MSAGAIVFIVLVAVGVVRVTFRVRRRSRRHAQARGGLGPFTSEIALVAAREVRERLRGRLFRVGTIVILLVVAAAIIIPVINKSKSQPQDIGVVGVFPQQLRAVVDSVALGMSVIVRFDDEPSLASARSALRSGKVDVLIVNSQEFIVDQAISPSSSSTTAQLVEAAALDLGEQEALIAAHLNQSQTSLLIHAKALPVTSLVSTTSKGATQPTSIIGVILLFVMLNQYNTWILIGVMEEKSSRVVEVLLAAVKPIQLLAGKVLGIGAVALAQAALIVAVALGLAKIVGSDLVKGTAPEVLAATLLWLILGFAFYCWVYAAAGSMAERQDQIQSLAFPLSLPIIFGYIMALTAASSGSASELFKILAYLPPTAPFAMPVLVGLHAVSWWEFAASALISVVATFGIAHVASNIYRRAILRTGRKVKWREVVTRSGN